MNSENKIIDINPTHVILLSSLLFKYPTQIKSIQSKVFYLLKDLSHAPILNVNTFMTILCSLHNNKNHNIYVYYDPHTMDIIALFTLLFEPKLIRNGKKVAHLEDFVIHKDYRKRNIGSKLLSYVVNLSKKNNCYKILLTSDQKTLPFYIKNLFKTKDYNVCMYL